MANIVMVNPASGDDHASLFAGPDTREGVIDSLSKGTMLKVIGSSGNFHIVEYDNGEENITKGGSGNTGTVVSYPYASMYNDIRKSTVIAKINTGTACEIIDDSNTAMIKIKAFTTEGTEEGFVEAKFIYRDEEESVQTFSLRAPLPTITTGVVTSQNGVKCRETPSGWGKYVGAFNYNAKLTILETKSGWYKVLGTDGWGIMANVWVSAQYVRLDKSNSTAAVPKADTTPVTKPKVETESKTKDNVTSDGDDWETLFASYDSSNLNYTANDEYYKQLASKYTNALGAPPKYNMDIDIQYMDELTAGSGRVMNKTILSTPSILSICPGKVKMFPNLMGTEKDSVVEAMLEAAGGNTSLKDKINQDDQGRFSGRLYKFEADTANYALYLNALCRACTIMLGIGDELMPNTSVKLKNFDYAYWSIRKTYNPTSAGLSENELQDTSLFRAFGGGLLNSAKRIATGAVDDTTYINFFLNGNETSVSESIVNNTTDSPIAGALNTVSSVAAQLNYFTGSGFDVGGTDVSDALDAVIANGGGVIAGVKEIADNFIKGGRMVLPKMVEGSTYGKSISCNMRFVSPYGNKYSVFLKCIVPICHIIALAFPKQLSDNMYTYPFLVRCAQTGHFNVDLGIISSLTITRGGNDDTSWSIETLATEWDVTMEITPLVDELMISSTSHPVLMCKNEMLLDYLANFCGFDVYANNLGTKFDLMMAFIKNKFTGIPATIENKISDTLYNKLNNYFRLSW